MWNRWNRLPHYAHEFSHRTPDPHTTRHRRAWRQRHCRIRRKRGRQSRQRQSRWHSRWVAGQQPVPSKSCIEVCKANNTSASVSRSKRSLTVASNLWSNTLSEGSDSKDLSLGIIVHNFSLTLATMSELRPIKSAKKCCLKYSLENKAMAISHNLRCKIRMWQLLARANSSRIRKWICVLSSLLTVNLEYKETDFS